MGIKKQTIKSSVYMRYNVLFVSDIIISKKGTKKADITSVLICAYVGC